jgi:hypothetical protein
MRTSRGYTKRQTLGDIDDRIKNRGKIIFGGSCSYNSIYRRSNHSACQTQTFNQVNEQVYLPQFSWNVEREYATSVKWIVLCSEMRSPYQQLRTQLHLSFRAVLSSKCRTGVICVPTKHQHNCNGLVSRSTHFKSRCQ